MMKVQRTYNCFIHALSKVTLTMMFLSGITHVIAQDAHITTKNKIEANATLEPKEIKIGEWANIKVEVKYPKGYEVFWPKLEDKIIVDSAHQVDIVKLSKIDTLATSNVLTQSGTITISAFDSGSYTIPPLVFSYREKGVDSLNESTTLPLLLTVNTVPVDTLKPIKPIKPPLDLPFIIKEIATELIIGGVILLLLIIGLVYYFTRKKKEAPAVVDDKTPLHELALKRLEEVEKKQYWQQGEAKKYYSEISDIVREYIEKRFRVLALESTTYELIVKLNNTPVDRLDKANLRELLELADLVKFAKVEPLPDEHFKAMILAKEFVQHTRVPDKIEDEGKAEA